MRDERKGAPPGTAFAIFAGLAFIGAVIGWLVYKHGNLGYLKAMAEVIAYAAGAPLAAGFGFIFAALIYANKSKTKPHLKESAGNLFLASFFSFVLAAVVAAAAFFEGKYYTREYYDALNHYKTYIYIGIGIIGLLIVNKITSLLQKRELEIKAQKIRYAPINKPRITLTKYVADDGAEFYAIEKEDRPVPAEVKIKAREVLAKKLATKMGAEPPETETELMELVERAGRERVDVPLGFLYGWDAELAGALESIYRGGAVRELGKTKAITYLIRKRRKNGKR